MKLSYESHLDDVTESAVRRFLRGKTYATHRWRGAALCAAVFAVFAFLGFHARGIINLAWICAAAAAWGAGLFLLTYKGTVRKRIASYVTRETEGRLPYATTVEISGDQIRTHVSGNHRTFHLADLTALTEDGRHLELAFGGENSCLIPLRAFSSDQEKAAFMSVIRRA